MDNVENRSNFEFFDEIGVKLVCLMAGIDCNKVFASALTNQDWAKLTRAFGVVAQKSSKKGRGYWMNLFDLIYKNSLGEKHAIN